MACTSFGGSWTLQKLNILERYLDAYTTALKDQPFSLIYVDAFAGQGSFTLNAEYYHDDYHDFRSLHAGSPQRALAIQDKPFDKLVFCEIDPQRFWALNELRSEVPHREIEVRREDANEMLPRFCANLHPSDRAVVFLDPFATEVSWSTIEAIANTERIDCWILFPVGAIARLMPRDGSPSPALAAQLDRIFGASEYWQDFYQESQQLSLFDPAPGYERLKGSLQIADRFRERLKAVFVEVAPTQRTFRNSKNSPMFELFFGASNPVGARIAVGIADHILKHW